MTAAQITVLAIIFVSVCSAGAVYSWRWGDGSFDAVFAAVFAYFLCILTLVGACSLLLGMCLTGLFPWQEGFWS